MVSPTNGSQLMSLQYNLLKVNLQGFLSQIIWKDQDG
ncbi:hypothetical protein X975_11747, partial [Stegodyphus mimosarum]